MIFESVPKTIQRVQEQTGDSLNAMAIRAGVSYATVHSWKKGTASPSVDKFGQFLKANNFIFRVVNKV